MIIEILKKILIEKESLPSSFHVLYLKEALQSEILSFIYSHKEYKDLLFYWWTSMRFILWLNRLSEDLDFVYPWIFVYEKLSDDLKNYFSWLWLHVDSKIQKFRITLKFRNLLDLFWLKYQNSSDLYLKIEISDHLWFCKNFTSKLYPINHLYKSFLVRSFDESTLFSTKLNAVLYRKWEKMTPRWLLYIKWRDFYDLMWYLQKWIQPNINCIQDIETIDELKTKLTQVIESTDFTQVVADIRWLIEDTSMVEFMEEGGKQYILDKIRTLQ